MGIKNSLQHLEKYKQQWGYANSSGEYVTITLPISFSSACYGAVATMTKEVGYALMITAKSTRSITVYTRVNRGVYYLAVGK